MANKFYGSANSQAEEVIDLYGSSNSQSQRITKLYGSSNGVSTLIHQGFGHADYGYGIVEYYTDSSRMITDFVTLSSQSDVNKLAGTANWSNIINGVTISRDSVARVILTDKVTSLPEYFLNGCSYIKSVDISRTIITTLPDYSFRTTVLESIGDLPNTLTTIGKYVLYSANWFSQTLILPPNLTSIGINFLSNLRYSSPTINVGSLPATIVSESAGTFSAYNYSSVAYTQGVYIAGANRAAWMSRLPNSSSLQFRKLVDAGY